MEQDIRATPSGQPATPEPSLASRLGPSDECQAQGNSCPVCGALPCDQVNSNWTDWNYEWEPDPLDRREPAVERLAFRLACERGGGTIPLSSYDLDMADEMLTGRQNLNAENARLRLRIKELERASVDRRPQGGDGEAGSIEDESAVAKPDAQNG